MPWITSFVKGVFSFDSYERELLHPRGRNAGGCGPPRILTSSPKEEARSGGCSGRIWSADPDAAPREGSTPVNLFPPGQLAKETLEIRADALQFTPMHLGELGQHLAPATGKVQLHLAPVVARGSAEDELFLNQPVHQADGAVVLDEQLLRQIVDGDAPAVRTRPQDQHRLIVLAGQACFGSRFFAEAHELAERATKRREFCVVAGVQLESLFGPLQLHGASLRPNSATAAPIPFLSWSGYNNIVLRYIFSDSQLDCPGVWRR